MNENGEIKTLDRLKQLYPNVTTEPLPLSWSSTEKNNSIGLSNGNLRVHYKGDCFSKKISIKFSLYTFAHTKEREKMIQQHTTNSFLKIKNHRFEILIFITFLSLPLISSHLKELENLTTMQLPFEQTAQFQRAVASITLK
jgi:hypothetical protein